MARPEQSRNSAGPVPELDYRRSGVCHQTAAGYGDVQSDDAVHGDWNRAARGAATFYRPACHGLCWSPIRSEVEHETVGRVHSIHSTPGASFARKWLSANLIKTFRTASPA